MRLSDFLKYDDIVVQCHDNPDADALASGFGIYEYLKAHGKEVRFIYSGRFKVSKSNLTFFILTLNIPIEFVTELDHEPELLITSDCFYGEGNVKQFPAKNIAVIDHHMISKELPELSDVRQGMGSCSTIVWDLLRNEEFEISPDLQTALYYGLFTDTNELNEINHPLDRDMLDSINPDKALIKRLCNMNLSLDEAKIAGIAMLGVEYHEMHRYALLESEPCDPNILGLISDLFLSVDTVDVCLVFSVLDAGVKFSVRSCVPEVNANELADYMSREIGSGGGHGDKAGGFLQKELLIQQYDNYADADDKTRRYIVTSILREKLHVYFTETDIIRNGLSEDEAKTMKRYRKLPVRQGYACLSEFLPEGTPVLVRTLEGDTNLKVSDDNVIMIGMRGEVYASKREVFERNYQATDELYDMELEYFPTVKNSITGEIVPLAPHARICISNGGNIIRARALNRPAKVFTKWNREEYFKGEVGDYLACKANDPEDAYIINKEIFKESYEEI